MDAISGKFVSMLGNGPVPIDQYDVVGMRRGELLQHGIGAGNS